MNASIKSIVFAALVLPFAFFGNSSQEESHEPVGRREPLLRIVIDNPPTPPEASVQAPLGEEEKEKSACCYVFDRYPAISNSGAFRWKKIVSPNGESVELDDGSVWKVNKYDGYKVLSWKVSDELVITQNHRWFTSYQYRIINQATGTSIEANLFLGPIVNGIASRYASSIDFHNGLALLTDGTQWEICPSDFSLFANWANGDAIIIGFNSGWDSKYDGLLINVNMNQSVRAKQY